MDDHTENNHVWFPRTRWGRPDWLMFYGFTKKKGQFKVFIERKYLTPNDAREQEQLLMTYKYFVFSESDPSYQTSVVSTYHTKNKIISRALVPVQVGLVLIGSCYLRLLRTKTKARFSREKTSSPRTAGSGTCTES